MILLNTYCAPRVMRDNQYNCVFFRKTGGVYQFDIKGDSDKFIPISDADFDKHFEVLSHVYQSKHISGEYTLNGVPTYIKKMKH